MLLSFNGKRPVIGKNVYIAPTAVVIGDVTIAENAGIWFNAVIRGDMAPITIGAGTNIQDNCTLHTDPGCPLMIGKQVTVGHNAVVHGCTIEDRVLVGMQAVVMNHSVIRTGSIIAAGAVIREWQQIGPDQLAAGVPAQVKQHLEARTQVLIELAAEHYIKLAQTYAKTDSDL